MILLLMVLQLQEPSSLYVSFLSYVTDSMSDGLPADTSYIIANIITLCINIFTVYCSCSPRNYQLHNFLTFCVNTFVNIWLMVPQHQPFKVLTLYVNDFIVDGPPAAITFILI